MPLAAAPIPLAPAPIPLPTAPIPLTKDGAGKTLVPRLASRLRSVASLLLLTLREIFDENAYQRFLDRENAQPSRRSYARFRKATQAERTKRIKCC